MSPDTIIILAAVVYALTIAGMAVCIWLAVREGREVREEFQGRASRSELYPPSESVAAATRQAPFDGELEAEIQKAQDYIYGLSLIDSAFPDWDTRRKWDEALGSRN